MAKIKTVAATVVYLMACVGFIVCILALGAESLSLGLIAFGFLIPAFVWMLNDQFEEEERQRQAHRTWYANASTDAKIEYHLDRAKTYGYGNDAEIAQALAQNELRKSK